MMCPVCRIGMLVVEYDKIELDYCHKCKGVWFDAGELELLTQVLGAATVVMDIAALTAVSSPEKARKCPRCDRTMDKVKMGEGTSAIIDRCPRLDGLWFDAGELGRTIELPATGADDSQKMLHFIGEVFNRRAGT